jgi:MerR family mercuric resistance operon transcriptional regulator
MKALTIGRLARATGVNLETVRYYERRGLLPRPPRSTSGYRLFPEDAAKRLKFIRRAQELGFSLREIRELLSLRVARNASCTAVCRKADAKIADIESKIRSLESMKKTLSRLRNACAGRGPISECSILESLEREGE